MTNNKATLSVKDVFDSVLSSLPTLLKGYAQDEGGKMPAILMEWAIARAASEAATRWTSGAYSTPEQCVDDVLDAMAGSRKADIFKAEPRFVAMVAAELKKIAPGPGRVDKKITEAVKGYVDAGMSQAAATERVLTENPHWYSEYAERMVEINRANFAEREQEAKRYAQQPQEGVAERELREAIASEQAKGKSLADATVAVVSANPRLYAMAQGEHERRAKAANR